jgi:P4 family phage/plasmid primase-like protien
MSSKRIWRPINPMKPMSRKKIQQLAAIAYRAPISIPQVLVERLKQFEPCYIKVRPPEIGNEKSGKAAFEKDFQNHPYNANDPSLLEHLKHGGNYGVIAGKTLAIVETDSKEAAEKMEAAVKTFTVRSGGGGWKRHFYITLNSDENGVLEDPKIEDVKKRNVGHIQVENRYVVAPNSRHWTGNVYEIINDQPIAFVSKKRLEEIFGNWLKWTGQQRAEIKREFEQRKQEGINIPLEKLFANDIPNMHWTARGEWQGAHPLHGSEGGMNFCVHPTEGWYCHRHNSGGDGLLWLAVKHGLIECEEAKPGALRGLLFVEVCKLAQKEGFDVKLIDTELSPDVARFFKEDEKGNKKFVPARAAKELMDENRFLTQITRTKEGIMFRYNADNGIYEATAESYINAQTAKKLGEVYDINKENQIKAFIEASTYMEIPETSKELLATKNGVLNVVTLEFFPFNPDYYIFNAIPVIYDPNAKCPTFDKYLHEVVPSEDGRKVLQEHAGYCLLKDNRFQKALMLVGLRQNGKSTFLNTITALLGAKNVSAVPLHILSNSNMRFFTAQLYNKLANICTDLPSQALKETDTFKKAVSGDPLEAEFKFQQGFTFVPYAKQLYSANQLPPMPKDIDAFIIRWDIVDFPNSFLEGDPKRDPHLLKKLTTHEELSGLLNWALEGLQRLLKNGAFSKNKTMEEAIEEWSIRSDAMKTFVEKYLIVDLPSFKEPTKQIEVEKTEVYSAYLEFCRKHNVTPISSRIFNSRLPEYINCGSLRTSRRDKDGNKIDVNLWTGIRFKTQQEGED